MDRREIRDLPDKERRERVERELRGKTVDREQAANDRNPQNAGKENKR